MIIITGHMQAKPEHIETALKLGCEHSARSRSEPGCLSHNCYVDAEDGHRIHFFERWESAEAVNAHFALPSSREFMAKIGAFASSAPSIEIFNAQLLDPAKL